MWNLALWCWKDDTLKSVANPRTGALLWPIYNPAWVIPLRPHRYVDLHFCTVATFVGPLQGKVYIQPSLIIFRCSSSSLGTVQEESKGGEQERGMENQSSLKGPGCFILYTASWSNATDLICVRDRDTLQGCFIHSAALNYSEGVCAGVSVCWGRNLTTNNEEDRCNDKINPGFIRSSITWLTTAVIPKISF